MKRFIISILISVLSRGISGQSDGWEPYESEFFVDREGSILKSIKPRNPSSISDLILDVHPIDTIDCNTFVNLTFNELGFYNSDSENIKAINLQPEIFNTTDAKILRVTGVNFPVIPNPFRSLNSVKSIRLESNDFESFPVDFFADFPHLLNLEWEQRNTCKTISSILFSKINEDLEYLVIKDGITNIEPNSFDRFKKLAVLVLGAQMLDLLRPDMFSGLHNLQQLDLSSCGISSIEANTFYDLPLTQLNLEGNSLQEIPSELFHGARHLEILSLSDNQIQVIRDGTFQHFSNLTYLDLSNNQINHIEPGAFADSQLESLSLKNNSLEVLHSDTFQGLSLTLDLTLAENRLHEISSELFRSIGDVKNLYLNDNQIKVIRAGTFQNFSYMSDLYLHNNQIDHIESGAFAGLHVDQLDLGNNLLEVLQRDTFQDLHVKWSLNLGKNMLQEIPSELFRSTRELNILDLDDNHIKVIKAGTFQNFSDMFSLNLNNNQIERIESGAFSGSHLQELLLTGNLLEALQSDIFQGLDLKASLNLDQNRLQEIPTELFHSTPALLYLYLNNNEIKEIRNGTFQNLADMEYLDLSYNQINHIEEAAFPVSNKLRLNLENNPVDYLPETDF